MDILALIPARGGSLTIRRKNIRPFAGHPLLAWSIAAAKQSRVTRVIVSTDDLVTASIARTYGAEVIIRPQELAGHFTRDWTVFHHALITLGSYCPRLVVHLRPTSPLRPCGLIDDAIKLILEQPAVHCVRGMIPSDKSPFKSYYVFDGRALPLLDDVIQGGHDWPRQLLPKTWWHTGVVDVVRPSVVLGAKSLVGSHILPFQHDPRLAVDIDTIDDWERAEKLADELDIIRPEEL